MLDVSVTSLRRAYSATTPACDCDHLESENEYGIE
jgi:hypothetical protein